MNILKKFWKAFVQLFVLHVFLLAGCYWGLLFTTIYKYSIYKAWWAIMLKSFSLITIPTSLLIFLGLLFPPLPVDKERITDWETEIVIRWTTRGNYPELVRYVIKSSFMSLKDYKNIKIEVVTDKSIEFLEFIRDDIELIRIYDIYREIIIPPDYQCPNKSLYKARALEWGAKESHCNKNAYILHLDEESIVDEYLYLGVRQFISIFAGYVGQGIITYANKGNNFQSWFCHMADAMRTGDDFARWRLQCIVGFNMVGMKGSFMVIPNHIEQSIGFDHGPHSSITEDAYFAFSNWNKIRFCRGFLREQSPFTILDTIKQRRRWASGLWKVLYYHPIVWWKKIVLFLQMIAWILSPLVVTSFIVNFVLFRYSMPIPLAIILGFNFSMFNMMYIWGNLHLIHHNFIIKILTTLIIPILLPLFMILEGLSGVYGTLCPVKSFNIIEKELNETSISSASQTRKYEIDGNVSGCNQEHV